MKQRSVIIVIIVLFAAVTIGAVIYSTVVNGEKDESLVKQDIAFMILDEKGGTEGIPDAFYPGQNVPLYIGIGNGYPSPQDLTAEVMLVKTLVDKKTRRIDVQNGKVIQQCPVTVPPFNLTVKEVPISIGMNDTGWNQVRFILYRGAAPAPDLAVNERLNQSYRVLWLPVVNESDLAPFVYTSSSDTIPEMDESAPPVMTIIP